jgi:hypothetical protein
MAHSTIAVESQKPQPTGDSLPPAATVVDVGKPICNRPEANLARPNSLSCRDGQKEINRLIVSQAAAEVAEADGQFTNWTYG